MTKQQRDGFILILLGIAVFVILGFTFQAISPIPQWDFKTNYWAARSFDEHLDPYNENAVTSIYNKDEPVITRAVYPPTLLLLISPLGLLPWKIASLIWCLLTVGAMISAAIIIWDAGKQYSPLITSVMVALIISNSQVIVILTNPAAVAIALAIFASWSFVRGKYTWIGAIALSLSILIKPQDAGFIWLFFLLAGGMYRRFAVRSLLVSGLIGVPTALVMWRLYPNWFEEWKSNIASFTVKGGMTDPGPSSIGNHGLGSFVNLQAALSVIKDNPHFYNPITYLIVIPLLALWAFFVFKSNQSSRSLWMGIAASVPLSMLPIYHHVCDAKILLLAVPACSILWAEGKRLIPLVSMSAMVFTSDIPLAFLRIALDHFHANMLEPFFISIPILIMGIFCLLPFMSHDGFGRDQVQA
ncbi:MAG: glycosyltransferase family 87 protein [Terracidiphilus sp.]